MLKSEDIASLKASKNLLAFSGGADSTALFFLLLENQIPFDIAIVDYAIRAQSKEEVSYAQELALTYKKNCHLFEADEISTNFEANARKIRYDFFEELILSYRYEHLLTAHHLGDRLEWFFMQLCKGAGCAELNSLSHSTQKDSYKLLRPLLHVSKSELIDYLKMNNKRWFEDETNEDTHIKRNEFRHLHVSPLLEKYSEGIKKSFEYMDEDNRTLIEDIKLFHVKEFYSFTKTKNTNSDLYHIDKILKRLGVMISAKVRDEIKENDTSVVSRKYIVAKSQTQIFITPYICHKKMDKEFKERCRILKIPVKLRPYLFLNQELLEEINFL
ncbi:MAG: tRNA lysidine(34) synthetase TilS [Thiovulaceae bacterium]|nr:tRNA lysidine(34) synthetase TilS [Sulfurimonadaceae bacterium]